MVELFDLGSWRPPRLRDARPVRQDGPVAGSAPLTIGDHDPGWSRVQRSYAEGVRGLQRLGSKYVDWTLRIEPAGAPAIDLAGHVLATARSYHRLLDAALAGAPGRGLPRGDDLGDRGAAEPVALGLSAGADRIVAFDAVATRYGERVHDLDPELVLGVWEGLGALTIRQHTMLAACEWHLHAWDLAGALGWDYRPPDAELLLEGRRLLPEPLPAGAPWPAVLVVSGRQEPPGDRPLGP